MSDYDIAEVDDGLEVRGVTRGELTQALQLISFLGATVIEHEPIGHLPQLLDPSRFHEFLGLYSAIRTLQSEHVEASREDLLRALMGHGVSLTPAATLSQAKRLAAQRNALLATPFHTYASLSEQRRNSSESSTRTWVARARQAHKLFSVDHDGRTLIPAFQFDEHLKPRIELAPILAALAQGGVRDWSLWTWLTSPTSFLSGGVPERIATTDPARALRAAQRFAAGAAD
ncbi:MULTISPECIES: hypothetical protein [Mycolicibacter]|uniref:DUF2384 domain-containing protein n=2 Tax=Mycolicibacter TaxID=1073531 RepID=A0ABU5XKV4_9MYCO|nr:MULTISPECIES: hypothetical protein [unclassified Mycolicibacter]MEB3022915.1 hypothetical protein [Mycolicibacter sp. MYC098]MEB3034990.1 hypothetical protein [Mycolicibacter sp. MYC340]